ncbi:TetR/AcrR family transcriptional regulator [Patulibacter minatonensis]|uniref:TetR/AcrR family transcriptional regulator n=1 Tax=Patulibacter minatonensis TaxID=298163 RepID=UPI0004B1F671|nr:TetR/AcrR family transcriptional regulator [Patulibacter minatonensis]
MPDSVAPDPRSPDRRDDDPTVDRLPRGRHGLSREEVVRSQRERIIHGMAGAMAVDGYVGTSVTAILKRAGVSRQTFYEQFTSKEECFAATYAWAVEIVLAQTTRAAEAGGPGADPGDRVDRMLESYLGGLASKPQFARVLLIETYAAGPTALQARIALQRRFVEVLGGILGATTPEDLFRCEVLVGAISSLVTARLATGDTDGVLALQEPLSRLLRREAAAFGAG